MPTRGIKLLANMPAHETMAHTASATQTMGEATDSATMVVPTMQAAAHATNNAAAHVVAEMTTLATAIQMAATAFDGPAPAIKPQLIVGFLLGLPALGGLASLASKEFAGGMISETNPPP